MSRPTTTSFDPLLSRSLQHTLTTFLRFLRLLSTTFQPYTPVLTFHFVSFHMQAFFLSHAFPTHPCPRWTRYFKYSGCISKLLHVARSCHKYPLESILLHAVTYIRSKSQTLLTFFQGGTNPILTYIYLFRFFLFCAEVL